MPIFQLYKCSQFYPERRAKTQPFRYNTANIRSPPLRRSAGISYRAGSRHKQTKDCSLEADIGGRAQHGPLAAAATKVARG